jgi:hypothetical protein
MEHYYTILKLKPDASIEDVKKAYKKQVKIWHPDRFPAESPQLQKNAHEMFQKITTAYKKITATNTSFRRGEVPGWEERSSRYARDSQKSTKTTPEPESQEHELVPGFVTRVWPNGDKYEGQLFQDQMHGRGILTSSQGYIYTGDFKYGKPHGLGKLIYDNGDQYEGSLVNDMLHGKGKISRRIPE